MKKLITILVATFIVISAGCREVSEVGGKATEEDTKVTKIVYGDKYPEVLKAKATHRSGDDWLFSVTLSSAYDSPKRYADAWRVVDAQGKELGIRILGHDHANEQPFTRSGTVEIPKAMTKVFVEGRDQANGWSGQRFEVTLPVR